MALAVQGSLSQQSITLRHFRVSLAIAFGTLGFGLLLYAVEKYIFALSHRFIENPGSVMMRAGGLAHFTMGWLYLVTSPNLRSGRGLGKLLLLLLAGIALCVAIAHTGGLDNPFVYLFLYAYFLAHAVRDEYRIYQMQEQPASTDRRFLASFTRWAFLILLTIMAVEFVTYSVLVREDPILAAIPAGVYWIAGVSVGIVLVGFGRSCFRSAVIAHGSIGDALWRHRPLAIVLCCLALILLLGTGLGGLSFNIIILLHGGTWIAFICWRLRQRPSATLRTPWQRLRNTVPGFLLLHGAVFLIFVALMAARVHLWNRCGWVSELVERSSFPYWSVMHITLAFWRPKG